MFENVLVILIVLCAAFFVLRWFGLHGNSVMALLIGGGISGGCAVPGIMATRTLRDPKERIATLLVVPFMNCGAKLPIFGMLTAAFFSTDQARMLFAFTLLSWGFALLAAKLIRSTVLRGPTTPFVSEYRKAARKGPSSLKKLADQPLWPVVEETLALIERPREPEKAEHSALPLASAYAEYRQKGMEISNRENEAALENTVAGRLGRLLERVTRAIGFDYRINIALLGGFVAKEVIVSTLGTAYSLGSAHSGESGLLVEKLKRDPQWTPLRAFTLILFTMLYVPCFATLVVIKKESSLKWVGFSIAFNLVVAYVISFAVYQGGKALGFGV